MHEWSLAYSIILTLKNIVEERKLKNVKEIEIEVSNLSQLDLDILKEAILTIGKDFGFENLKVNIRELNTRFKCNNCGYIWSWIDIKDQVIKELCEDNPECDNPIHISPSLAFVYLRCPKCGSIDFEILDNIDVRISKIVGEVE